MLSNFIDLFTALFSAALSFDYIFYLIFGVCLVSSLSAIFLYLLKGRY